MNPNTEQTERFRLRALYGMAEKLRGMDPDLPVVQMSVLFYVALHPEVAQKDIGEALNLPSSTASRSVASLSKYHRLGKMGLELVESYEDPVNRRVKLVRLTPKGASFIRNLLDSLD